MMVKVKIGSAPNPMLTSLLLMCL